MSRELQQGKAAEHLVCADLILNNYNAFLSDQGLPYDIVVDYNNKLYKIQVKSTSYLQSTDKNKSIYNFGLRRSRGGRGLLREADIDFVACVAIDRKLTGRIYSNGTVRKRYGRFIEDYEKFKPEPL